jgi:hypothetical protein
VLKSLLHRTGFLLLAALLVPAPADAYTVTLPYPLVPNTTASAAQVMADFTTLYTLVNGNLDATNLALTGGIYANQIVPTNSAQATFGGTQTFAFPEALTVGTNISALDGFLSTSLSPSSGEVYFGTAGVAKLDFGVTTSGTFTFSNFLSAPGFNSTGPTELNGPAYANAGFQVLGIIEDVPVSGQAYSIPFDANSPNVSTNTHYESGTLTTATFSGGYACAPVTNFKYHFTNSPWMTALAGAGTFVPITFYLQSKSATSFQICAFAATANSGTEIFDWTARGE